jgi:hypothetical protein
MMHDGATKTERDRARKGGKKIRAASWREIASASSLSRHRFKNGRHAGIDEKTTGSRDYLAR